MKLQAAMSDHAVRPRVLAVEDDPDYQILLREWLTKDYDLVLLPDGEELADEVGFMHPDALVLDIGLPGPDGLLLCEELRHHAATSRVPILVLSARDDDEAFAQSLSAGASAYLNKLDTTEESLKRTIDELLPQA